MASYLAPIGPDDRAPDMIPVVTRTTVVTGSASGIGAATRALLESRGERVIGVDLHDAEVIADLANPEGRTALIDGVTEVTDGAVDAVIACAGISADDPLTVRVNYFGAVATLEGLRPMLERGHEPRAVAISSIASLHAHDEPTVTACLAGDEDAAVAAATGKGYLVYPSSKRALARWLRREAPTARWAGAGIALNAIAPGVVITPMTDGLRQDAQMRELMDAAVPMPLNGHARAEQVAPLLVFLASPQCTHITGQVVFIDGGADAVLRGDSVW
jgi:NAD(P)-dependent dehydrogenase (short-subunit alcohol dehydrogenase family)